jgi:hypothetical protein
MNNEVLENNNLVPETPDTPVTPEAASTPVDTEVTPEVAPTPVDTGIQSPVSFDTPVEAPVDAPTDVVVPAETAPVFGNQTEVPSTNEFPVEPAVETPAEEPTVPVVEEVSPVEEVTPPVEEGPMVEEGPVNEPIVTETEQPLIEPAPAFEAPAAPSEPMTNNVVETPAAVEATPEVAPATPEVAPTSVMPTELAAAPVDQAAVTSTPEAAPVPVNKKKNIISIIVIVIGILVCAGVLISTIMSK